MRVFVTLLSALLLAGCAGNSRLTELNVFSVFKAEEPPPRIPTAAEVAKVCKRHGVTLAQLPMEGQPGWTLPNTLVQARLGVMKARPNDGVPCTLLRGESQAAAEVQIFDLAALRAATFCGGEGAQRALESQYRLAFFAGRPLPEFKGQESCPKPS